MSLFQECFVFPPFTSLPHLCLSPPLRWSSSLFPLHVLFRCALTYLTERPLWVYKPPDPSSRLSLPRLVSRENKLGFGPRWGEIRVIMYRPVSCDMDSPYFSCTCLSTVGTPQPLCPITRDINWYIDYLKTIPWSNLAPTTLVAVSPLSSSYLIHQGPFRVLQN